MHLGSGYYATKDGNIFSLFTNKILNPGIGTNGRYHVCINLKENEKRKTYGVHVLICEAFHGKRPLGLTVSHKDGNRLNNDPDNLCWETYSDNLSRRNDHGTHNRGFNNSRSCMTPEKIEMIFYLREYKNMTHKAISKIFNVSRTTISRILEGKRYND